MAKGIEDGIGQWWPSDNEESYSLGSFKTPEAAVDAWQVEHPDSTECVLGFGEARSIEVDGERIIEDLADNASENLELYEDAMSDWCSELPGKESLEKLNEDLTKVFHKWLEKNGETHTFCVIFAQKKWTKDGGILELT